MGIATKVLIILFCVNLVLWLAGDPYYKAAAPVFLIASKIAGDQSISWDYILKEQIFETVKQTIIIIGALVAIMIGLSKATGSVYLGSIIGGGGGGFGAVHALTIAAIIIFVNFAAMPNFSKMFSAAQYSGGTTEVGEYKVSSSAPNPASFGPWFLVELILRGIFGFLITLGIFGLLRGE